MERVWRKLLYGSLRRRRDCWCLKKKERAATSWGCGSPFFLLCWVWETPRDIMLLYIFTSPSARHQSSSIRSLRWECKFFSLVLINEYFSSVSIKKDELLPVCTWKYSLQLCPEEVDAAAWLSVNLIRLAALSEDQDDKSEDDCNEVIPVTLVNKDGGKFTLVCVCFYS